MTDYIGSIREKLNGIQGLVAPEVLLLMNPLFLKFKLTTFSVNTSRDLHEFQWYLTEALLMAFLEELGDQETIIDGIR